MSSSISRKSNRSVLIQSADGGDASYGIIAPVKPFFQYRMAGWMKTENLVTTKGKEALLNVHGIEGAETPPSQELNPSVTINAMKIKEPISQYIYGQFIEHLGRCILGGLWAEMLDDRKFYYPITDTYAPWDKTNDLYLKG